MFRCFRSCRSFALHRGRWGLATAHEWDRAIGDLKHTVRLASQLDVKPVVKRQKNDAADAQAIAEAASRFVAAKTEQQARAMIFRMRDLLVRQPTQLINALRGRLAEHGIVAAQGPANVKPLADASTGSKPYSLRLFGILPSLSRTIELLGGKIIEVGKRLRCEVARSETAVRMQSVPGDRANHGDGHRGARSAGELELPHLDVARATKASHLEVYSERRRVLHSLTIHKNRCCRGLCLCWHGVNALCSKPTAMQLLCPNTNT